MGIYLNPGNELFAEAVRSEIYVDKTGLIKNTNRVLGTSQKFVCVSRPRRFGKSMAANMLAAYYGKACDSQQLFSKFEIAADPDFQEHLNRYHVIFLNMQRMLSRGKSVEGMLQYMQHAVLEELLREFEGQLPVNETVLSIALEKLYQNTGEKFVFIIDEWDYVFRTGQITDEAQTMYLDFLRDLLKDQPYVILAYMTGILPIKKYGTHSALNMFDEYSMTSPRNMATYIGFTEDEVKALCEKYGMDFDAMKNWYDGYSFSKVSHIYNPKSVVDALRAGEFASYWTQTETYEALKIYIDINHDGLKDAIIEMLVGTSVCISTERFQNDMTTLGSRDDVLTLLIHLGYLAFDKETSSVRIPNAEIRGEFQNAIEGDRWDDVIAALKKSDQLLQATWEGNEAAVAEILDETHSENTSILTYNDENSLSCVIALSYYNAMKEYTKIREFPSGKGYADIVYLPKRNSDKPAMVVELKYDHSAEGAIAQMKEKHYTDSLKEYSGNLLLVGINYDKKTKKHSCLIERMQK